jgi:hypothetical protein
VAHACNPSYSGGRDQEDHSSKPAQAPTQKGLVEWLQGIGPEYLKKKNNNNKKKILTLIWHWWLMPIILAT